MSGSGMLARKTLIHPPGTWVRFRTSQMSAQVSFPFAQWWFRLRNI